MNRFRQVEGGLDECRIVRPNLQCLRPEEEVTRQTSRRLEHIRRVDWPNLSEIGQRGVYFDQV